MAIIRQTEIKQRRTRKLKLKKLRVKYQDAKNSAEKEKVITKLGKIAPWVTEAEFLAPLKK